MQIGKLDKASRSVRRDYATRVRMAALNSTAQVGLTMLYIFQHALKAKFELLGIRAEIEAIRKSGDI